MDSFVENVYHSGLFGEIGPGAGDEFSTSAGRWCLVASLLVGAWAAPQRPNGWVFDSTPGETLNELNELVLSLPATIVPEPIARPRSA